MNTNTKQSTAMGIIKLPLFIIFGFFILHLKAQTCSEIMDFVKSEERGTTYYSFNSDAISKVTFYDIKIDYTHNYFAIVCFKNTSYGCTEYIYLVDSNTKLFYSINYLNSAGEAFWKYIQPHNKNLGCAPSF